MPEARNSTAGHTRPAGRARNIRRKEPKSTPETLDFQAARDILAGREGMVARTRSPPYKRGRKTTERCRSGRSGRSRKPLCVQAYRGFESHPLRQKRVRGCPWLSWILRKIAEISALIVCSCAPLTVASRGVMMGKTMGKPPMADALALRVASTHHGDGSA